MAGPIITGADLAAHLGGVPDPALCDLIASAVSAQVAVIQDVPADPDPWWDETRLAALGIGADTYKATTGTGGGYQLDATSYSDVFRITSTHLRRYESLLAPHRAVGGMLG